MPVYRREMLLTLASIYAGVRNRNTTNPCQYLCMYRRETLQTLAIIYVFVQKMNNLNLCQYLALCTEKTSLGNVRAASLRIANLRVCELQVCEFASWKVASHIIWKKVLPENVASDTYLSQVKYWHVASLGIKLSKAGNNKGADIRTFFLHVIS